MVSEKDKGKNKRPLTRAAEGKKRTWENRLFRGMGQIPLERHRRNFNLDQVTFSRVVARQKVKGLNALLDEHTDAQAASILNQRGLRTGAGQPFDPISVRWVRSSANLKSLKDRLLAHGWLTTNQIVARLGINRSTVATWRSNRRLTGRICTDRGEWLYRSPDQLPPDVTALVARVASSRAPSNVGNFPARGAI